MGNSFKSFNLVELIAAWHILFGSADLHLPEKRKEIGVEREIIRRWLYALPIPFAITHFVRSLALHTHLVSEQVQKAIIKIRLYAMVTLIYGNDTIFKTFHRLSYGTRNRQTQLFNIFTLFDQTIFYFPKILWKMPIRALVILLQTIFAFWNAFLREWWVVGGGWSMEKFDILEIK